MSARDELAWTLRQKFSGWMGPAVSYDVADELIAGGYRKTRTIATAEELDALPAKSAILDHDGTPWVGDGDKVEPWASVCEDPFGGPIWKNSIDIPLPATVLHEPGGSCVTG